MIGLRRAQRLLAALGAGAIIWAAWAAWAAPALAAAPVTLGSGYVTDKAGALGSDAARVEAALEQLNDDHNVQLFVVFVDSFDGMDSQEWTETTFDENGLGLNDILLAVAVVDRQYWVAVESDFPLSDAEMDDVAANGIEPELQDDNWAEAVIAGAEGYGDAIEVSEGSSGGDPDGDGSPSDGDGTSGAIAGLSFLGCCLPLILLLGGGGLIAFFVSRKRRSGTAPGAAAPAGDDALSTKELETKAGRMLVEVDDALKTSEQELGFAEAEFGAEAVREYQVALADAKRSVGEAFRIQQEVYDAHPEPEQTKREMLKRIIVLAGTADAELDARAESFAGLRDLAGRAEEALAAVTKRADAIEAALPATRAGLAQLKAAYLPSALGEVADDDEQAAGLLTFARTAISDATAAITAGERSEASLDIRACEDAVAQAERLLAAVAAADSQLAQAREAVRAESAALEQAAAAAESQGGPELASLAAAARQAAATARAAAAAPPLDPFAQLTAIRASATQINSALSAVRDAAARAQAERTAAQAAVKTARDRITSAEAYIVTRRGAIGAGARSNIAEAKARLASAELLVQGDPGRALAEAQAAQQYADAAVRLAQADVSGYSPDPYAGTSGGPQQSGMPNLGTVIVGSILADVLGGAISGGGGGFSGGSRGSSSRSFGGGGFSPRSFGGSSHRGGGGSFGGGGHRGGGGKF